MKYYNDDIIQDDSDIIQDDRYATSTPSTICNITQNVQIAELTNQIGGGTIT